jgi:ligand-binding SRPBCC domain-containing protein
VISFDASVRIERPLEDVYAYVAEPGNFPHWNSAVEAVRKTSAGDDTGVGSTYVMERTLPTGRVVNGLEIVAHEPPTAFAIRTTSGPTPFHYHYRFVSDGAETTVHLDASVELPGAAALLGPLAARRVRRGVDANFAALKRTLEARDTM